MATVKIDIPGIGIIEAQNAASESTLRELVSILGKKSAGGSGGSDPAAGILGTRSPLGKSIKSTGGAMGKMGGFAKSAGAKIMKMGGPAVAAAKAFIDVGNAAAQLMGGMASLDKNVSGAAGKIPLVGSFFAPIIDATEKMVNGLQSASGSGASFGGQLQGLTNAAANAGMTVDEYSKFVRTSGEAFRLLGGNVEAGRKRFESLSKEMRMSGMMSQLNALGYTSDQVNVGMSKYTKILGQTGKLQGMSTQQLAVRSANYMKEIDKLAKATGQEREQIEENQAKLLADAQFQGKVANMSTTAGDALRNTITGLKPSLQGVAKDILATGTATTKESEEFAALMPDTFAMLQRYAQITENGGVITEKMQQDLQNQLSSEGKVRKQQYRDQGRYNSDIADAYMKVVDASNIVKDSLVNAGKEQDKQIKLSDGAVAGFEAIRRRINEIGIEFMNLLQGSGMLGAFMDMFEGLTKVMRAVIFPVFQVFGAVLKLVIKPFQILGPIVDGIGVVLGGFANIFAKVGSVMGTLYELVGVKLMQAFYAVTDTLSDFFRPALDFIGRMVNGVANFFQDNFVPILQKVGNFFQDVFQPIFETVGDFINDHITPIFEKLYNIAIKPVVEIFTTLYNKVADFFDSFSGLGDVVTRIQLAFSDLGVRMLEFRLTLKEWADKLTFGTSDEELAEQKELQKQITEKQLENDARRAALEEKAQQNIEKNREIRRLKQEKIDAERAIRDSNLKKREQALIGNMWSEISNEGVKQVKDGIEKQQALEYNLSDPLQALKKSAVENKSYLVSDKGKSAIQEMQNKKAADDKAKDDEKANKDKPKTSSGTQVAQTTSTSSDPVSVLNTNMQTLIMLHQQQIQLLRNQNSITAGLSSDIFSV